ncbi:hypothetical protein AAVH_24552 [Aphelenchoides avenae]|nr:hypothetical protein AAVH_24552 [Aphelenchus avenae]
MTFSDFRKLFRISKDTEEPSKFKTTDADGKGSEEWEMAASDDMILPVMYKVIEAEVFVVSV